MKTPAVMPPHRNRLLQRQNNNASEPKNKIGATQKMKILIFCTTIILSLLLNSQSAQAQDKYLGEIFWTAATWCPDGTEMATGQTLAISKYAALYSLFGTTYGGDGAQTFALPDLRGRVSISSGTGPGLSNYVLGEETGTEFTKLLPQELPGQVPAKVAAATAGADPQNASYVPLYNAFSASASAHENRQPLIVLNACIVTLNGVYPPRP